MPRTKGPRKINRYGDEFKARAVKLSYLPGVQVQEVAEALDIHPFMLSKWRKQVREGLIVAKGEVEIDPATAAELKRLRQVEREYALLKEEHSLLKRPSGSAPNESGNLRVHRAEPEKTRHRADVPVVRGFPGRFLRLAAPRSESPAETG